MNMLHLPTCAMLTVACAFATPAFAHDGHHHEDVASAPSKAGVTPDSAVRVATIDGLNTVAPGVATNLNLVAEGEVLNLDLLPHSVRSADFQVMIQNETGFHVVDAPPISTFRGTVTNRPGWEVTASVFDGRMTAVIRRADGTTLSVQPEDKLRDGAAADRHIIIENSLIEGGTGVCAVDDDRQPPIKKLADPATIAGPNLQSPLAPAPAPGANAPAPVKAAAPDIAGDADGGEGSFFGLGISNVCEIAFDADIQFFIDNGQNVNATVVDIENVMNDVAFVYERDVDTTFEITVIVIRTTFGENPYTTSDPDELLCQFRQEWNTSPLTQIRRDTAHFMTGRNLSGSTLGVAWLGVVCNVSANVSCPNVNGNIAYGLSESNFSGNPDLRASLTAHEIGHNFSAQHCSGGGCHIMCASINNCGGTTGSNFKFGNATSAVIESYADSRTCLPTLPAVITPPFFDDFPTTTLDPNKWLYVSPDAASTTTGPNEPSPPNSARLRSFGAIEYRDGELRTAYIDLSGSTEDQYLQFEWAETGLSAGQELLISVHNASGHWTALPPLVATGVDSTSYQPVSYLIPSFTENDRFRVRFQMFGDEANDNWFLDNVYVGPFVENDTCPTDIDNDDVTGFSDLLSLLGSWGFCGSCDADLNNDGFVDFTDLVTMLSAWGPCIE